MPIVEKIHRLESAQCAFLDHSKTHFPYANQTIRAFEMLSFLQLENPFFVNAGSALDEVSFPLWSAFKQVWQQAASLLW